jgi:hypothetical protein
MEKKGAVQDVYDAIRPVSFDEFQGSKRLVSGEEATKLGYDTYYPVLVYLDAYFIEDMRKWDPHFRTEKFFLLLGNSRYVNESLEVLERMLYAWYVDRFGVM